MKGVNKVILVGALGSDPETKYAANGSASARVSLATSESWKDKNTGQKQEKTEWHRVKFFGRLAEIAAEFLRKGSQVYIEGKLSTSKYTGKDGVERQSTEIIADQMQMLGGYRDGVKARETPQAPRRETPQRAEPQQQARDEFDDDIPF